ncbi:MAG: nucleotidyltransferase domain-containing protein [Gemmatimonadetes bacterium]|nr:nucleotidyltransferase domain-containing protein [Gemmatimonadota bacterium]
MRAPLLDPDVAAILPQLQEVLSREYGERLRRIILFGSRIKGSAGEDSDVDVAVLLSGTVEDPWEEELRLDDRLRALRPRVDLHVFSETEFNRQAPVPGTLAYPIAREGAAIL